MHHSDSAGVTLAEICLVSLIFMIAFAAAFLYWRAGREESARLRRIELVEESWQRQMLKLKNDLRSAVAVETDGRTLQIRLHRFEQQSQTVAAATISWFINEPDLICRSDESGAPDRVRISDPALPVKAEFNFEKSENGIVNLTFTVFDAKTLAMLTQRQQTLNYNPGLAEATP